jgi:hypothetical protein
MEVAWSKRMLEDLPLEISQRLSCLVGSMGKSITVIKFISSYKGKVVPLLN